MHILCRIGNKMRIFRNLKHTIAYNINKKNLRSYSEDIVTACEMGVLDVYRYGTDEFFGLINKVRESKDRLPLSLADLDLLETDIGKFAGYKDEDTGETFNVPLDFPMSEEMIAEAAEYQGRKVELDKPKKGGSKKFFVYVKNPKTGKVKKVEFGAKGGGQSLRVKLRDPKARKAFDARHGCSKGRHNDKTKAGYWSCRLPRFWHKMSGGAKINAAWW
jgi:hypothetical protein